MYHSEHGQDKWLNENIFKGKRDGVFVEFGAIDGILTSNTLFFEKELGWSGILIEPNPVQFSKMLKCGRSNSKMICAAVGACDGGIAEFSSVEGVVGWSGVTHAMDDRHLKRIEQAGGGVVKYNVPVITLEAVFGKFNLVDVDYLSIDVEGAEAEVVSCFPFSCYRPHIVGIENNYDEIVVLRIMEREGYERIARLQIDDIYRRNE